MRPRRRTGTGSGLDTRNEAFPASLGPFNSITTGDPKAALMFYGWDNFFYMMGSAAAALIGLLFVVVTLTAGFERSQALRGASLYMTPTALHFAVVLSIAAVALAPRVPTAVTAGLFAAAALVGLGHALWACIGIRSLRPGASPPHWTDFWCYGATPFALYLGLLGSAYALWAGQPWAVHAIAVLLLALLLCGVRNAWDLVTWMAPKRTTDGG